MPQGPTLDEVSPQDAAGLREKGAVLLAEAGIEVRNVAGGMTAWASAGLPAVRDDGAPGDVA